MQSLFEAESKLYTILQKAVQLDQQGALQDVV